MTVLHYGRTMLLGAQDFEKLSAWVLIGLLHPCASLLLIYQVPRIVLGCRNGCETDLDPWDL